MFLDNFNLAEHGAELFPAAVKPQIADLLAVLDTLPSDRAGIRISGVIGLPPTSHQMGQSALWPPNVSVTPE